MRIVSTLNSRGINYRQKVGDFLFEPEPPSNLRSFGYPITALCWLNGNQRADCLQVQLDPVSLILVKYKQLRDEFPSHCFDA